MVNGCQNLSSHKIGEEIPQNFTNDPIHNMTSYLCDYHFKLVMTRDTKYFTSDPRFDVNPKYIRYDIEIRKYSSNAIKGIYIHIDDKGKEHEKYDLIGGSFLNKKEGDKYVELMTKYLNSLLFKP